ncbi:hypothetical protein [Natrinema altunense]|uniref:Uncharacterized protein n=2 Tax=Natrinema altunense TaxID=222984 RepID=L9ZLD8_NATA2|nr:hypothetical protein [Natrinema altunense]ELY87154.1 hypothetical protein C485_09577 [Natrinema altunense JCM 12890]RZH66947.1 hypothetical protein ELS17_14320 [Natrinema altunense]
MYRAILPEGQIECDRYDHVENGVELYDEDGTFIAFIPYANLHALADERLYTESTSEGERSIM